MNYTEMRKELREYYENHSAKRSEEFRDKCVPLMDAQYSPELSSYKLKEIQYRVISEQCEPIVFKNSPFYYETGTIFAHCDGAAWWRGGRSHAAFWAGSKNNHMWRDQDPDMYNKRHAQGDELLYLITGHYCDHLQHYNLNCRPILEKGLSGVYEEAKKKLDQAETEEQRDFLCAVMTGLLSMKLIAEKYSEKAEKLLTEENTEEQRKNLERIAETAKRVPWNPPKTFYEALNTLAFMRRAFGSLEGVGPNTFGRVDLDLYPFYKNDIESGRITKEEAYELIGRFLTTWDCHYDHDMLMEGYADHELENTYILGGCDRNGEPVYNDLTRMFLRATGEEKIIFPKIKARFSKNSPEEYLDDICRDVSKGMTTILHQNDDATIPALERFGFSQEDARDYLVTGCWGVECNGQGKGEQGNYVNILKAFEMSVHDRKDIYEKIGISFEPFDNAASFDEVFEITVNNVEKLFFERASLYEYRKIRSKICPLPLFSATMEDCLEKMSDYTLSGGKYDLEPFMCCGFPNIVDSLIVIKTLCFDQKKYTLAQLLSAVRANWEGYEHIRRDALKCHCFGDGSEDSCALAGRLNDAFYEKVQLAGEKYGVTIGLGYLNYTEIRWWGEKTLATPDGRRNGDYFSQGITPSRLRPIPSVTDVIRSTKALDKTKLAANTVINIILPADKMSPQLFRAFMKSIADSSVMSLQLNCVTKEELLDAQVHPEDHEDIIVRVTGFSAKFTSLSRGWQDEFLSRNFYE